MKNLFEIESIDELNRLARIAKKQSKEDIRRQELTQMVERLYAQEQLRVSFTIEALYQIQTCICCKSEQIVFRGLFKVKQNGLRMAEQIDLTPENLAQIKRTATERAGMRVCVDCTQSAIQLQGK